MTNFSDHKPYQRGFTIIEMTIVLILIAILATVALPKLFNLQNEADTQSIRFIAGSLSSANAENYAVRVEKNTNGNAVTNCTSISALLQSGLPAGYTIKSKKVKVNVTAICTLKGPSSTSAHFNATGIK
jgi:prepilin-type N-terminal cleavage/methylation domain-containing protein